MLQQGSILNITDNTGIIFCQCIKVIGPLTKRIAFLGDTILISVKSFKKIEFSYVQTRKVKKYKRGDVFRALVLRVKRNFLRLYSLYIKFDLNCGIIVNKAIIPVSSRVYGPTLRELCVKRPSLGCITRYII